MECHFNPNSETDQCIVLDLDETLVHSQENFASLAQTSLLTNPKYYPVRDRVYSFTIVDPVTRVGEGQKVEIWGVERPDLRKFINFCCRHFRITAVWSAGRYRYVHAIVNNVIFKGSKCFPGTVFTYDDCSNYRGKLVKQLSKMFKHSCLQNHMRPSNTFVIDDRESTFTRNLGNGVLIPEYLPNPAGNTNIMPDTVLNDRDNALTLLMAWFMKPNVKEAPDVRSLNKSDIFMRYNRP